jgi:IS4 transposase
VKKGESLLHAGIEPGDIAVADRNFAKTPQLRALAERNAFYAVRTGLHSVRMLDPISKERLTSAAVLDALGAREEAELSVLLEQSKGAKTGKPALLPARLIITRASDALKSREEARIQRSKSLHGVEPTQETKALAGVVLFLTNLPEEDWPIAKVGALYRLRWQIELAFKMLKSTFHMRDAPANEPQLARTWILANLISALLTHLLVDAAEQAISPSAS